jgi:hypothetical protein
MADLDHYGHGLSFRLVCGSVLRAIIVSAADNPAVTTQARGALGEGWSSVM